MWIDFVDNEGAKHSLIKGSSKAVHTNQIVFTTWETCRARRLYPWWERVSSADNPVDKASRGDLSDRYGQNWEIVEPVLPATWGKEPDRAGAWG